MNLKVFFDRAFNDGYYLFSDNQCHYFVKDHLGSVRTVVNEKGALEQVTHYYPLGGYFGDAGYKCRLAGFQVQREGT